MRDPVKTPDSIRIVDLLKCKYELSPETSYLEVCPHPATGKLYVTPNSPHFISGHVRMRGKSGGEYPFNSLEMIDYVFGKEDNIIEVCSGNVRGRGLSSTCFTVDINPEKRPDLVADAQKLDTVPSNKFSRWRCDPPYNEVNAQKMYGTTLPVTSELLKAGARVCKIGSLLFLLLGPQNYEWEEIVELESEIEYNKLHDLLDTVQYCDKLLSQYGYDSNRGEWNVKDFPITQHDKQMDGIKSDIEKSRNAVQEYNEYLEYLGEKYDVNFDEIDDCIFLYTSPDKRKT